MDPRGLTTLALGVALMLSPVAFWLMQDPETGAAEVAATTTAAPVETDDQAVALAEPGAEPACTAAAIISTSDRVDCNGETTKVATRRVMSGGAVFVQVGD